MHKTYFYVKIYGNIFLNISYETDLNRPYKNSIYKMDKYVSNVSRHYILSEQIIRQVFPIDRFQSMEQIDSIVSIENKLKQLTRMRRLRIGSKNEFLPKRRGNVVDRVACRTLSFRGSGRNFLPSVLLFSFKTIQRMLFSF